jgi:hypothetical protein
MAGILDKKTRIMDVIVTREGRRQMADGNLRATFATFTDKNAFYEKDIVSGSTNPCDRLYFEAFSLSSDQIIFEKDDSGRLIGDIPISDMTIFGDNIFKKDAEGNYLAITGSAFNSEVTGIVTSSITNFRSQRILGSIPGNIQNSMNFDITRNKINFKINNKSPFGSNPNNFSIDVQSSMPLFFDQKLSANSNFKYLPPVHPDNVIVANFEDIKTNNGIGFSEVITKSSQFSESDREKLLYPKDDEVETNHEEENTTFNINEIESAFTDAFNQQSQVASELIQNETINFKNTTSENNLFCQIFEVDSRGIDKRLTKLDVVLAEKYELNDDLANKYENTQTNNRYKELYYVGKTFKDDLGIPTFIRLFTLMFD